MPTLAARVKDALSTADEIGVDPVRFFLQLLLQIGGANIEDPPTSSSLAAVIDP
jgi:hypothetical protein